MDMQVHGKLRGTIAAPPSKSQAHRLIIASFLSGGSNIVSNVSYSQDILATIACCRQLGGEIECLESSVRFHGRKETGHALLNCQESGSTLRFMLPIACALGGSFSFTGEGRLPQRPIDEVIQLLQDHGISASASSLPLTLEGKLSGGEFLVDPSRSSQPLTGLLYALPLLKQDSYIRLTGEIQSKPYVNMTLQVLERFGILIKEEKDGYFIPGQQSYQSVDSVVEGDWSNGTFWLVAGAIGQPLTCQGLDMRSKHGDKAVVDILKGMGAQLCIKGDAVTVSPGTPVPTVIDATHIPDAIPALAVAAACGAGKTVVVNAQRLRIKESDRIQAVVNNLRAIGGQAEETSDGMVITGGIPLEGGTVDCCNDHRIAMAFAIASLRCRQPVTLLGADCVKKSYPHFYEEFKKAGGEAHVLHLG